MVITGRDYAHLCDHLFPGDNDEHGAAIIAGVNETQDSVRLLVREVIPAIDGRDFVPGKRSYRRLLASFIMPLINDAARENLVYLAVHNHGGSGSVEFSSIDLDSHSRNYPALLAITGGVPVGALVLAQDALAGSIWLDGERQVRLRETHVIGPSRRIVLPSPRRGNPVADSLYDRQIRLLGKGGVSRVQALTVGVLGLGGVGMACVEAAGRLGVQKFVLADPRPCRALESASASRRGERRCWHQASLVAVLPAKSAPIESTLGRSCVASHAPRNDDRSI